MARSTQIRVLDSTTYYIDSDINTTPATAQALVERLPGAAVHQGESGILVRGHDIQLDLLTEAISNPEPVSAVEPDYIEIIPVRYDGPDLEAVADATGYSIAQVIELHCLPTYRVRFCGFSPGFSYLVGLQPELILPRRSNPRTVVPAGSVAIASTYSAVYPSASPGGWHLLGSTTEVLFDPDNDPPARLPAGTFVKFEPTP